MPKTAKCYAKTIIDVNQENNNDKPKHKYIKPFYIYCYRNYIYLLRSYIYAFHIYIYACRIYIYCNPIYIYAYPIYIYTNQKRKRTKQISKIKPNDKFGHLLTAVCKNWGFGLDFQHCFVLL